MLDDPTIDKLAPLLTRLGSGRVADRAATAAEADRLLKDNGTNWDDLVAQLRDALVRMRHPTPSQATQPGKVASASWQTLPYRADRPALFWRSMPDGVLLTVQQQVGDNALWTATVAGRAIQWDDGAPYYFTSAQQAMSGALIEHHKRMARYLR